MSRPGQIVEPPQVPHGATARRLEWPLLPPPLRREIERRLGSPVRTADTAGAGFTPGFASVLTGEDGRRLFVKAASRKAQRVFADSYAQEIRRLRALPPGLPVPRLVWSLEDDDWVVLALEYVDGPNPDRPWRGEQLDACLDTLAELAEALTPPPMVLPRFGDDFAEFVTGWDHVRQVRPGWPHLEEAAALAAGFGTVTAGETLVHTDAR
ncbi:MAG: phosphotransferase, partial [Nocardioidaceae bacterium]